MKKLLLIALVVLSFFALFRLYLQPGFPYTHDGENHLARFANYKIALKEGQFPPRFAPNLMNHYGYPVFNYNYPLANILSVPFSTLGISYELTFKLLVILSVFFGALGVWQLAKVLRASPTTRWLSVLFWLLQPFLVSAIYFRGNIGEVFALSLLPWLLWLPFSSAAQRLFGIVILTAFLLSHNISAVIGSGIYLSLSAVCLYRSKQKLLTSLSLYGWAVLLSLWFWLPAVAEISFVVVGSTGLVSDFTNHFVTLSQLLWSPLRFGFSYLGGVDSLSFSVGLPTILVILGSLILYFKKEQRTKSFPQILLCIFAVLSVFGQLAISRPFWEALPSASFIQFPWRLSLFTGTLLLPSLIYASQRSRLVTKALVLLLIFQVIIVLRLEPVDYFHKNNIDYDVFSQSTSTQNENRTKEFTYAQIGDWRPEPKLLDPTAGSFSVQAWSGSARKYSLQLDRQTTIIEPTMYFPGWITRVEESGYSRAVEYQIEDAQGRIAFLLPAGEYQITSKFTQNTPSRLIGNTVSILGFGVLLFTLRKRHG